MTTDLAQQLDQFSQYPDALKIAGFEVESIDTYCFSVQNKNTQQTAKKYDVFVSGLIHGNEVGGLGVINSFLGVLLKNKIDLKTKILFHLGNIEAAKKEQRFLERDLNRSFLNSECSKLEEKIARKIEKLVLQCSYNLDLHQTNSDSQTPFFVYSFTNASFAWSKYLDSKIPSLTSTTERHKDGSTLDFFCRKNNIPSCTLELGQVGFHNNQIAFGVSVLQKLIDLKIEMATPDFHNMYKVVETLYWNTDRLILKDGFVNFSLIQKGEVLGHKAGITVVSPHTGALLFPKYGKIAEKTKEVVTYAVPIASLQELD